MNIIIACKSIKPELELLKNSSSNVKTKYLPQNLHRTPHKLKKILQETINKVDPNSEKVILGFGLCSNAIVDIIAPQQGLYVPLVHDCIAFYLGSREKYKKLFKKYPGTYYLTKSWISSGKDPLGLVENEYTQRVGKKLAKETMEEEIKNYKYISFVNSTHDENSEYLGRAKENAEYFSKEFVNYKGNDDFFKKILFGPYDNKDFIYIKPGEKISQKEFLK